MRMTDSISETQPALTPGLTQCERVSNTFTAPSKTFNDIAAGNKSWWLPFLITALFGYLLFAAVATQVSWKTVYENEQRNLPEFAQKMMENMSPEQKAKADQSGPRSKEITWALAPFGLLLLDVIGAGLLLATINFGFGGKASFGKILTVELYAGLVQWPVRFILGAAALFAGAAPEAFNPQNPAGTNLGYFLSMQDTPRILYVLATNIDVTTIWSLVLTSIGLAAVAGTKRSAGYIAVFGWWVLGLLVSVAMAAMMG
jgi:hypothetical protein